jgi:hypothetical protein
LWARVDAPQCWIIFPKYSFPTASSHWVQLSGALSRTVLYSQNCRQGRWRSRTGRDADGLFKAMAAIGSVDPETMIAQMRGAQVLLLHKLH